MYTPFLLKFNNLICFVLLLLSDFWIQSLNFCYQSWINAWLLNLQSWIKLWLNWWVTIVLKSSTHIAFKFCRKLLVRIVVTYNQYWSTLHFFQRGLDINAIYFFFFNDILTSHYGCPWPLCLCCVKYSIGSIFIIWRCMIKFPGRDR